MSTITSLVCITVITCLGMWLDVANAYVLALAICGLAGLGGYRLAKDWQTPK